VARWATSSGGGGSSRSAWSPSASSVRYICSPRALPYVERAIKRTRVEVIRVEPLAGLDELLQLTLQHGTRSWRD
jgi:hypothetical protein